VALGAVGIVNVLRILLSNPKVWEKTALIVSYDENGGFFDHVTPPTAPANTVGEYIPQSIVNKVSGSGGIAGPIGLGNRVPCLVISPYSRGGRVDSTVYDHTSQLPLIETRFGARAQSARRLLAAGDHRGHDQRFRFQHLRPEPSSPRHTGAARAAQTAAVRAERGHRNSVQ
jgi:phospholipase C